ncbi:putative serine/threonine-protein kinase PBL1 [Heracleum sosnowskyi]|uniref:Serine/threonine-protein kinase PBL1 n=1 Tax=Heracleum sosnowskyi TaxID=360622 RepID=A0AAD8GP29_9APIA|nr:putative serine/threonine-protein kinase PBL1 [Heracleum sosnowskyi]
MNSHSSLKLIFLSHLSRNQKTPKSKFIKILEKCRFKHVKNTGIGANRNSTSRCISSAEPNSGNLARFSKWIATGEKDIRGIHSYTEQCNLLVLDDFMWFIGVLLMIDESNEPNLRIAKLKPGIAETVGIKEDSKAKLNKGNELVFTTLLSNILTTSGFQEHLRGSTAWSPELKMGCFEVLKGKKKTSEPNMFLSVNHKDHPPTALANTRARALSAPSSLHAAEQHALSVDYEEQLNSRSPYGSMKERQNPNPQPLPLPLPPKAAVLKNLGSFKVLNSSGHSKMAGPLPLPLPPPLPLSQPFTMPQSLPSIGILRNFSYEELATACNNFCLGRCMSGGLSSMVYRATFGDDSSGSRKLEATVTRLNPSSQGLKEFLKEVNTLGCLQHPYLCKLLGFHARAGSEWRMLVYEKLHHGSLDRLLYGRSDGPFLDWPARMKVAICAAKGLTFLHEDGPLQAMFHEFSTGNIQIDKDYSAKLSGYGCVSYIPETDIFNNSVALRSCLVEVQNKGLLTPKSNVWSFGIVLLELLTGRRNHDIHHPEERNLVKWSHPYLSDDGRLSLIIDPRLQGRFPAKAARVVADIVQRCLQADPSERPTMRTILEHLKVIQQMKFTSIFPLPEPGCVRGKNMSKSPSLNGIITPGPRLSISPSQKARLCVSPTRPLGLRLSPPPQSYSSTLSSEEFDRRGRQLSSSSIRKSGV